MRALGACGLVDCILDFVWFFHRISDYSIALQWLFILLLGFFFFGVRSDILTSNILMTEEQLCHGRGEPRHNRLLRHAFFPKKLATRTKNHDEDDIFPTTAPLWKQQRSNETSTMLSRTALYSILFRLICTAIATPLRSETYRVLHHRITIFTLHRPSRHTVSLSQCQCLE